jgi:hypothetical protein
LRKNKTKLGIVFIFTQALKQNKTMLGIFTLVSFLRKLEPEETMLEVGGFIFTQA